MMRILGNRVLLSALPTREQTSGGIILPMERADDKKMWWRIDQIGTGKPSEKSFHLLGELRVGQTVGTPLFFDHTTLEDGSGRKIVGVDQLVAVLE